MTRHFSFYILVCVVVCSLFLIKEDRIKLEALPTNSVVRVKEINNLGKSKMIIGDNIAVFYYGDVDFYPGNVIKIQKLSNAELSKDYKNYLLSEGIVHTFYAKEIHLLEYSENMYTIRHFIRENLEHRIENIYGKYSPLVKALIYGDKSDVDKNFTNLFAKMGISHLFSLSGFHLGIIISLSYILFANIPIRQRFVVVGIIAVMYGFLTGFIASITRSILFFMIYCLSFFANRRYSLFSTACNIASILLVINPFYLYDRGFVLSFLGVISISLFNPIFFSFIKENYKGNYFIKTIITTISAQILTLPISMYYFGILPIFSIFTNIVALPIVSLILLLSILSVFLSTIKIVAFLNGVIASFVIFLQKVLIYFGEKVLTLNNSYKEVYISEKKLFIMYITIILIYIIWENRIIKENFNDSKRTY